MCDNINNLFEDSSSYEDIRLDIESYNGKKVAFEGNVTRQAGDTIYREYYSMLFACIWNRKAGS